MDEVELRHTSRDPALRWNPADVFLGDQGRRSDVPDLGAGKTDPQTTIPVMMSSLGHNRYGAECQFDVWEAEQSFTSIEQHGFERRGAVASMRMGMSGDEIRRSIVDREAMPSSCSAYSMNVEISDDDGERPMFDYAPMGNAVTFRHRNTSDNGQKTVHDTLGVLQVRNTYERK